MNSIFINARNRKNVINRNIYGHFAEHLGRCIYDGLYVGEGSEIPNINGIRMDVVKALKHIKVPVLRWPGGCFADVYNWKDGIGPKESRKRMVNTHWGGVIEDNAFGTHEFMELCAQLECEPYINGNLGSGTVREMSEWVEYLTFDGESPMSELRKANGRKEPWKVKFWGVGNESWGCGGNLRPKHYADEYRRYQTYLNNYGDNKLFKIACGSGGFDYYWTETVMEIAGRFMDALTLHHYTVPTGEWSKKGSATVFDEAEYYKTILNSLKMEELISDHLQIMNRYDSDFRVGMIVDEWGTWYDVEEGTNPGFLYQQNTMRDAVVAASTLNIFNRNSDRIVMANIAQTVNVLQAMILTEGGKMLLTPTYHVFDLYKCHQDAVLVDCYNEADSIDAGSAAIPGVSVSASVDSGGALNITAVNLSMTDSAPTACEIAGMDINKAVGRLLTGSVRAHNTFERPEAVKITEAVETSHAGSKLLFEIPPNSVVHMAIS